MYFLFIYRSEYSIEVIDINPDWLKGSTNKTNSVKIVQLPKSLIAATSIVYNNNIIYFGGQTVDLVLNDVTFYVNIAF